MEIIAVNCWRNNTGVSNAYTLKLFDYSFDKDYNFRPNQFFELPFNRRVASIQIVRSLVVGDDYYMAVLTEHINEFDTALYLYDLK